MGSNLRRLAIRHMKWLKKYTGGSELSFDSKKLQLSEEPTILGVTYDLKALRLRIKRSRKEELQDEIDSIISSSLLSPGQAGKLRGKLMFGASQLWGKIGRAFLRSLSERQYIRNPRSDLNIALYQVSRTLEVVDTTWSTTTDHVSSNSESRRGHFH